MFKGKVNKGGTYPLQRLKPVQGCPRCLPDYLSLSISKMEKLITYPKIVATNPQPEGEHPGKILNWHDLAKHNGTLSMAGYEKIVLTHSAN